MTLSENIKREASLRGLSVKDLADRMPNDRAKDGAPAFGINVVSMSKLICGNPTVSKLQQIADVIGCDVADFFRSAPKKEETDTLRCPECGAKLRLVKDTE